jgi:hypothetical protein
VSNSYLRTSYHNCPCPLPGAGKFNANRGNAQVGDYANTPLAGTAPLGGLPFPAPFSQVGVGGYVANSQNPQANWGVTAHANNGFYGQRLYDTPNPENSYYTAGQPMPYPMVEFVPSPFSGGGYSQSAYANGGALGNGYAGQYGMQQGGGAYNGTNSAGYHPYGGGNSILYFDFPQGYLPSLGHGDVPAPLPTELPKAYGVNETAAFWGDPHIVDADRADKTNDKATSFDVTDAGLYNILEDKGIQYNAKFEKFPQWGPTVATEAGINLNGAKVLVSADGTATVNGKKLLDGETVTLKDGSKITDSGKGVKISTNPTNGEYDIELTAVDSGEKKPDGSPLYYIDSKVSTRDKGVGFDGVAPKGILGEGFDEDGVERKALKLGGADKYTVTTLIADDKTPLLAPRRPLTSWNGDLPQLPPYPPYQG